MVRVGLIGLGKMGISHCAILNAHPSVDLVAVCDSSSFSLAALRRYTSMIASLVRKRMAWARDFSSERWLTAKNWLSPKIALSIISFPVPVNAAVYPDPGRRVRLRAVRWPARRH